MMVGFPCTAYCAFNVRLNYRWREDELEQRQKDMAPMLRLMVDTFVYQARQGRYFLLENPESSKLWSQPELVPVWKLPEVVSDVGHLCAYGKVSSDGSLCSGSPCGG